MKLIANDEENPLTWFREIRAMMDGLGGRETG